MNWSRDLVVNKKGHSCGWVLWLDALRAVNIVFFDEIVLFSENNKEIPRQARNDDSCFTFITTDAIKFCLTSIESAREARICRLLQKECVFKNSSD